MKKYLAKNLNLSNCTLIIIIFVCEILSAEVPRPRGVSLSRASLYETDKDFTCFDGSKTIPFNQVNDDYCDCPDNSDEPGTSACPGGTFYCTNAGHRSLNIPSSRVNDGICDCCDGTDEYSGRGSCPNNCSELGKSAREEALRRAELLKAGKQVRAELSQQGIKLKEEKKNKFTELEKNRDEAEKIKLELEKLKKEAEELESAALEYYRKLEADAKKQRAEQEAEKNKAEAIEIFNKFDSNQDGQLDVSEIVTREVFDKDKNGEVSEDEAKYFLNNQESVDLNTFIEQSWPNTKPFIMMRSDTYKQPSEPQEEEHSEAEEMETEEDEQHPDEGNESEEEEEEHEPEHQEPEEAQQEPPTIQYDENTQKLVDRANEARNQFTEAEKNMRNIEEEMKNIQETLEIDFGLDEEFATLKGQCFEYEDREYTYKLCPFDKAVQKPKSSSPETRLGIWGRWAGPDNDKYEVMYYDRGTSCWNGPQRSATVRIGCSGENKLISVSEPNRCEYMFEFLTPAACRDLDEENNEDLHDEL